MINARLPDGRVLHFPDGTDPAVVQTAVKRAIAEGGGSASAPPSTEPDGADDFFESGAARDALLEASPLDPAIERRRGMEERRQAAVAAGAINPPGASGEIEDPGFLGFAGAALKENVAGPVIGLLERQRRLAESHPAVGAALRTVAPTTLLAEALPEGLRENVREDYERTREDYLAAGDNPNARAALGITTELATGLVPFLPGATKAAQAVGQGASRLAARVSPGVFEAGSAASRMLARTAGGAAEGAAVGLGNVDPNLPLAEQARQIGFSVALGGGMGSLGAAREVDQLAQQDSFYPNGRLRHGPPAPDPKIKEQVLGAFEADRAEALQKAQEGAPPDVTPSDMAEIQKGALRAVETRWQPLLAQAGAAGDEALGGLADRMQGALAPEIKAPPLRTPKDLAADALQRADMAVAQVGRRPGPTFPPAEPLPAPPLGAVPERSLPRLMTAPEIAAESASRRGRTPAAERAREVARGWRATPEEGAELARQSLPLGGIDAEAGFLRIGRNKPPAPPASPIESVMPRNEPVAPGGGPLARLQAIADRVTDQWFNRQDAPVRRVRRAGQHQLADELEVLTKRAAGAGGMMDAQRRAGPLYEGTYVYDAALKGSRRTGDGLQRIYGGMDDQALFDLDMLEVSESHMEMVGRQAAGDTLDIDPRGTAIAQQVLADLEARYGTTVDVKGRKRIAQLSDLADQHRDWMVRAWMIPLKEAGRFTDQEFHYQMAPNGTLTWGGDITAKNEFYAPFDRLMEVLGDEGESVYGLPPVPSGAANPMHRRSGGLSPDRPIARPSQSSVELAQKAVYWTERQRVRNAFADAVDATPALQAEIRKVPPGPGRGPKTGLPIQQRGSFAAWKDGTRSDYAAPPDVLRAFEVLTPKQAGVIASAGALAARTLRAGATITLEFPFRNLGRDVQDAAVYGPGFNPIYKVAVDPIAGLFEVMGNRQYAREWRANGGALSGGVAVGRPQIEATLRDVARGGSAIERRYRAEMANTSLAGRVIKTVAFPALAPMEALAESLESATKVGAYRRMRLRGMSATDAATASRDVASPDFGRAGSTGRQFNQYEAFFNAELQDLARIGKAFRRAPGTTTIKALTYLTLPAIANWYKNKDDEQYQALPEWERVAFYHPAKLDNGRYVRIPRPLGLINLAFSYGPQKFLEAMGEQDDNTAEEFGRSLVHGTPLHYVASLDFLPSAIQPAVEAMAGPGGWSTFRQQPIVPPALQEQLPEDRSLDQTSGVARAVGGALGVAPLKVDHLIQGFGAYWGRTLAQATGPAARMLGADPAQDSFTGRLAQGGSPELPVQASDIPGVRGFVSTPAIGFASDPVQRFYKLSTLAMEAKDSLDTAEKRGDVVRLQAILRDHPEVVMADMLLETRKELTELRRYQKEMLQAPGMTPEQRLELKLQIDQLVTQMAGVKMHQVADYLHGER